MHILEQSPTEYTFVQNPYPFYESARRLQQPVFWRDYNMASFFDHQSVMSLLKDRRFGRECPKDLAPPTPKHLAPFYKLEANSMLELEPPRHSRLRGLVLRAFTSRRIASLEPEIKQLCHSLIDDFKTSEIDLLEAYAKPLPVIIIARLLGVPESMADELLRWSNDMVMMYQARRSKTLEARAVAASKAFSDFMRSYIEERRTRPADDLITHLITAEENGQRLTTDEMITTCILLLNAGHEATVHTLGNGVKTLLETGVPASCLAPEHIDGTVEEILRYDPPLHMFTRYANEDLTVQGHALKRGDQIALMLGAAGRDPTNWRDPDVFDPNRDVKTNAAFGAGIHFCLGAALARLELRTALPIVFERCPQLQLATSPGYADVYHFHGLQNLFVNTGP
ncbi:cytochrome P450 [Paracoccaceae bacterium]|nr:cytochrome P450 [Paracoccaceae bacterium]